MNIWRRFSAVTIFVAVLGVGLAACSSTSGTTSEGGAGPTTPVTRPKGTTSGPEDGATPKDGGKLVFGIEAEPEGLDPTRYAFSSSAHMVASAVFDTLATFDADGNAVPSLATAIDGSADFKTWTVTIPTGVTFHDGTPLTAQIVVDNLDAYKKSYIAAGTMQIVESATAPDPTHVVVQLKEPFVDFPSLLASQQGYVIAPAMLADPNLVSQPIGTGAFVFQDHVKDEFWSFKKNGGYHQAGLPHLDAITFKPIPDNNERVTQLQSGDIDIMNMRSPEQILELRNMSDLKRVEYDAGEEQFIVLNTQKAPFDNLKARQAAASAIDYDRWRKEISQGVEPFANGPFGEGQPGYLADNGYPKYDLAKAKELVQQYTAETGQPFEFTFYTQADQSVQAETNLFQSMLQDAGMTVHVTALPQINLVAQIATGSYEMGRFRLFGFPNPDTDANGFWRSTSIVDAPGVSLNFPRFADPKVDEAIKTALASTDPKVRDEAYQTVNRAFGTSVPYIWLGRAAWMLAANERVNGFYEAANGTIQTVGPKTWIAKLWLS